MQPSMNRCFLMGVIGARGVQVSYVGEGTARATFTLVVSELGRDGKEHQLWQQVEVWGRQAAQLGTLVPGAWVVVDGKLKRTKRGEAWETVVSTYDVQTPRSAPVAAG